MDSHRATAGDAELIAPGILVRWLRLPLLHFLVGGALLFGLLRVARPSADAADQGGPPVVITAADIATMRDAYGRESGLPPTTDDEVALVDRAIDEELLFREAIARGLDRDRSVHHWLVEQMRILTDDAGTDEDALYSRAVALGLDRKDLVVRRILVQKMRLLAAREGEGDVDDATLRDYYTRHRDAYRAPARLTAWHVYLTADRADAATALLAAARAGEVDGPGAADRGDPFPQPPHLVAQSPQQLSKLFGADVAAHLLAAPAQSWVGPLRSPLGTHLFWIESSELAAAPNLAAVRGRVLEAWRQERRAQRLAQLLRALRERQPLQIESAAWRARSRA